MRCTHLAALVGICFGIGALLLFGGQLPIWLHTIQLVMFGLAALGFGFSTLIPQPPSWLINRYTRGVGFCYLAVAVLFTPAEFLISMIFMGVGIRHLMLPEPEPISAVRIVKAGGTLPRRGGDILIAERLEP